VHHRLTDPEIHQANPHAGGEQHRQPGGEAELGAGIIRPETDAAIATEGQYQQQNQKQADGEHIKPAEVLGDPALSGAEKAGGGLRRQ